MKQLPKFALLTLLACACADEPAASSSARRPQDHSGAGARKGLDDPSQFAGTIELRGALARAEQGAVLVMLRLVGQPAPLWAYLVDFADPEAERHGLLTREDGSRALVFALNKDSTLIGAPLPQGQALEIAAVYDPDGDIDSKEGQVRAAAPARRGDLGITLALDPDSQP